MGKTHGRLGQAGKVKNNTPVVPKTSEKSTTAGRATKREKYERRMANDGEQPNKQKVN